LSLSKILTAKALRKHTILCALSVFAVKKIPMNLREEILREHSKSQTLKIVKYIGNDKERFAELINLFLGNTYRITQRAAWAVSYCAEEHPELIIPYLERMLDNLNQPVHDSVKRNTLRTFQDIDIPEKLQGKAADICFKLLRDKDETIGTKVFAMTVLHNLSKQHPDLENELRIAIEEQMPYASAGFRSRGSKILKALNP
jgi:hypothetical protein